MQGSFFTHRTWDKTIQVLRVLSSSRNKIEAAALKLDRGLEVFCSGIPALCTSPIEKELPLMALILRIDVDRPYGKEGFIRHGFSYVSSEYYLPRVTWLRYLDELKVILAILNEKRKSAYVCYRRCTLPSPEVIDLMKKGGHAFALHLENSRSFETFQKELLSLQDFLNTSISTFSKHGSGTHQYGWNHFAPYEPEKYLKWAKQAGLELFLGNMEDPTLESVTDGRLRYFPSAFWLEPCWRDTKKYPIDWLLSEARQRNVVMLLHPDNVLSNQQIMNEFLVVLDNLPSELVTATRA